ncbi:carbohydrate ABC transporter permease [Paenibacillus doosanensis]|uniref:L-arabinose transport system permease protein AraQ n=1 Tax=Paenibacillus konkukensis TaxID=2020716 RepID=A0ABY4RYS8_9BACL|nr:MULTISPECIES: carbohydrate ABC transporter permease [Paenibacillus]MCS7460444.1 carbohydrate ABC transporter permease [Paenibacillus doosanensis]UQZ87471.1 L-arabinose transport system permease protein AraQ [Paenibacillus konkukensis]
MAHSGWGSRLFDGLNVILLSLVALLTLYPFWDSLIVSITPLNESAAASVHLYPKTITLEAYQYLLKLEQLWTSYKISILITILGTVISMLATTLAAYALSKKDLPGVRPIMFAIVFTMMFSGGIIPNYLVVKQLGMLNSVWAMMIPAAIQTYNLIIMRSFFASVPESLEESAKIDGCNDFGILLRIVIPLSMPAIATISLFYAVTKWNEFFTAVMYITDKDIWPLQLFLRSMLIDNEAAFQSGGDSPFLLGQSIKMATIMISAIPVMMIYPFFQRFFVQGVTLGAVKE